jgi:hypothetical protein
MSIFFVDIFCDILLSKGVEVEAFTFFNGRHLLTDIKIN